MRKSRRFSVVLCVIALAACGSKRPSEIADDGGIDSVPGDGRSGGTDSVPSDGESGDAASMPVASCVGLAVTCGSSGNDSCCNSLEVPGGAYKRSYDLAGDANSGSMIFPAAVSNFRLDKYEVTVGRFRAFVQAGMGTQANPPLAGSSAHASIAGSGWDATWNAKLVADTAALIAAVKCNATFQTGTSAAGEST